MILRQQKTLSNNHYDFNREKRRKQRFSLLFEPPKAVWGIIMRKLLQGVIAPRYEKLGLCRCCGKRLTYKERCKKYHEGKVFCSQCNAANYSRKYITY